MGKFLKSTIYIDESLYPDCQPLTEFENDYDRADYLHRVVTAFDFGIVPEKATIELLFEWRSIFDRFPVKQSPGYHTLRASFGWEPVESTALPREPYYRILDAEEDRIDPCEEMI